MSFCQNHNSNLNFDFKHTEKKIFSLKSYINFGSKVRKISNLHLMQSKEIFIKIVPLQSVWALVKH